jgi:hypothetical protein
LFNYIIIKKCIIYAMVSTYTNLINVTFYSSPGAQACKHPTLDVHAREIMRFIQPATPIVCSDTADWVKIVGSMAIITEEAKKAHGDIECAFTGK